YRYETNYVEVAEFGHFDLYSEHYGLNKVARRVQPAGEKAQHYASYQELYERIIQYHEVYDYDDRGRLLRVRKHTQSHSAQTPDDLNRALQPALEQQRQLAHLFGTEDLFEQTMGAALKNMMTQELQSQDYHEEDLYEYESETLKRIYTPGPLATTLHYEARQPDETDDLLFQTARDRLREHIIAYLKQHPPRERLYLLTLSYDAVCDDGVSLVLGWEQWRDEWHQRVEEPSYPELFLEQMSNVGPDDAFRSLPEPLPAAYERFIREMRGVHNWEAIRDMMVQVAQDLNQADWHGILETTDDFIVIANDYEAMNDPLDDIRASVPAEKLRILQAKGWIETK
ncbi:MAG TPA: hypothetical protein VHO69_11065, partial [Phototrophicaceae bacterium]|nr:hypothetical protein [Phototrophicaceae bacterium]